MSKKIKNIKVDKLNEVEAYAELLLERVNRDRRDYTDIKAMQYQNMEFQQAVSLLILKLIKVIKDEEV